MAGLGVLGRDSEKVKRWIGVVAYGTQTGPGRPEGQKPLQRIAAAQLRQLRARCGEKSPCRAATCFLFIFGGNAQALLRTLSLKT